ncbi:MAG: hypothetical protein FWF38_00870 [Spirochaetaceae bacterium]|nr:hypothetical protein [Spirochaetaceae bacterium]
MKKTLKIKYSALAAIILILSLSPLYSQSRENNSAAGSQLQPENLLGLTPTEVFAKLGAPESVYPLRGKAHWQDDVIFYYNSNLYLFFFDNRVWQIRCDHRSKQKVVGITPGMKKTAVRGLLGKPYHSEDTEDIYLNPAGITRIEKGFPIRLRLIYDKDNNLYDIYLYRGDY